MENKICKNCNIQKNINEFRLKNLVCKFCQADIKRKKYNEYIPISTKKICKKCNIEKNINEFVKMRDYCKVCRNTNDKKYNIKEYRHKTYNKNKENIKEKVKAYKEKNKEKVKDINRKWYAKKKNDFLYKLTKNIRSLIYHTFRNQSYKKSTKTFNILGCSFEDFKIYLESQFENWMTLENHGIYTGNYNETWQLDHIEPISNAKSVEDIIRLNHYTNFRPLCSRKNLEKSDKITTNN